MTRSLNLPELLLLASRSQEALRDAMNAAFGASLVAVSMKREDPDAPLDRSIIPVFEKMFARLVDPIIDVLYPDDANDDDIRRFMLGSLKEEVRESNHDFYMGRVEALIENSKLNMRRQNADKN